MTMIFTKAGLSISKEPRIAAAFVRSICVVTKGIDITCVTVGSTLSISEKEVLYWTSFYNNYIVILGHIDYKFVKNKNNNLLP